MSILTEAHCDARVAFQFEEKMLVNRFDSFLVRPETSWGHKAFHEKCDCDLIHVSRHASSVDILFKISIHFHQSLLVKYFYSKSSKISQ